MKKLLALLLAVLLTLGAAACGAEEPPAEVPAQPETAAPREPDPQPEEAPEEGPTAVALISDTGRTNDSNSAWKGVQEYCVANGVDYEAYVPETAGDAARLEAVEAAVEAGFDVLVLDGPAYGSILQTIQTRFPSVYVIALDIPGDSVASNTVCVTYAVEQAAWLAGFGAVEEGFDRLGLIMTDQEPDTLCSAYGFLRGAEYAAGDEVELWYVNSLPEQLSTVSELLELWYQEGVELVYVSGQALSTPEIETALDFGRKLMAAQTDPRNLGKNEEKGYNPVVTTTVRNEREPVVELLTALFSGDFGLYAGQELHLSVADGEAVGLPTEEEIWGFRGFTVEEYETMTEAIGAGEITVSTDVSAMPDLTAITAMEWVPEPEEAPAG